MIGCEGSILERLSHSQAKMGRSSFHHLQSLFWKDSKYPEKSLHVTLNSSSLYRAQLNIGQRRFTNECFLFLFTFFTATTQQRSRWLIFWPASLCQMMKLIQLFQDRPVGGSTSTDHTHEPHDLSPQHL